MIKIKCFGIRYEVREDRCAGFTVDLLDSNFINDVIHFRSTIHTYNTYNSIV